MAYDITKPSLNSVLNTFGYGPDVSKVLKGDGISKYTRPFLAFSDSNNAGAVSKASTTPTTPEDYAKFWNNAFTGAIDYDRLQEMWQKAADYNTAQVEAQRKYQAEREDTAVLRYAEQLKKLGINPAMAVGHQAGASGGTVASMSAASPSPSGALGVQLISLLANTVTSITGQIAGLIGDLIPGRAAILR